MRSELINCLRATLGDDGDDDVAILVARAIHKAGLTCEIETDDDSPDELDDSGSVWVTSTHKLTIEGETVATWTRCSVGHYGEPGRQCSEDEWCEEEDTNGGDILPNNIDDVLKALGLDDSIPGVPEPTLADDIYETDDEGEFALYWETVGDDAGPRARYATIEAATAVCEQRNREFTAAHPCGGGSSLLCGFGVRQLVDGKWIQCDDE